MSVSSMVAVGVAFRDPTAVSQLNGFGQSYHLTIVFFRRLGDASNEDVVHRAADG